MSEFENKIDANNRIIKNVLHEKKYTVDYFQREYKWETWHIDQLVSDLTSSFLYEYQIGHKREAVKHYSNYYLGSIVVSKQSNNNDGSIIDGQQRLTSILLLLIYINNLQKKNKKRNSSIQENHLESLIFSEKYGKKSFNIQVEERKQCLEGLFNSGQYTSSDKDDESTVNMEKRYHDIEKAFPDDKINDTVLPFFIDWLKEKVILVEITTYSDENAYTIFETMNDRGLNLTPTEMLKGFILSNISDDKKRQDANNYWKKAIQGLINDCEKNEDQRFVQAWFRAKYAETIRETKRDSENQDFEKIGTRFHSWFKDKHKTFALNNSDSFEQFIEKDFDFYLEAYKEIMKAEQTLTPGLEHIYYIKRWGIAESLRYPLLLAPITINDSNDDRNRKMDIVARYIEAFVVRRSINFKRSASSSIRYAIYILVMKIRNKDIDALKNIFKEKLRDMDEKLERIDSFNLHGQNKIFVKFLLSRMTGFIDQKASKSSNFETYYNPKTGKPFEVEHIWADKFTAHGHRDEFENEAEFKEYRNRLGGLVLLQKGTNQSYGAMPYKEKKDSYFGQNLLAATLCEDSYKNNPNFKKVKEKLPFKPHEEFKKQDLDKRQSLYKEICRHIWDSENLFA